MMKYASFPEGYLEEAGPDQRLRVSTWSRNEESAIDF